MTPTKKEAGGPGPGPRRWTQCVRAALGSDRTQPSAQQGRYSCLLRLPDRHGRFELRKRHAGRRVDSSDMPSTSVPQSFCPVNLLLIFLALLSAKPFAFSR
eukprot:764054-Hanusia_phi.AAC.6